ncbi:NfeD family protein [Sphingomicrobium astaxanthinifaciens]|uniref:NfeD family protein n=1 Tax=Sphingomicrobium astaxanthinifaciens TaxID=1227949 RepID=UPI001FCABC52|nr:NfeD family protein [Sphingomicrobium astaxanthinifaciens]MCJ7422207.1 NfeD family protein [Sphingomicrobium astaxanthinifaciens]
MLGEIPPGGWWVIGGILLLAAELMLPGVFLAFVGLAAIAAGLFAWGFDLGTTETLVLFAVYTSVAVLIGRRVYARPAIDESDGMLNERSMQVIGRSVTAATDFPHGEGRVKLGDSEWNARGPVGAKAGDRLEIRAVEGTRLIVAAPEALPPA